MTLEDLKRRILATGYLPEWLKDNVDLMGSSVPNVVMPATAPPQPETKKWCPLARTRLVQASGGAAFNRILKANPAGGATEMTTAGSFCIEGACQMWNGTDCGLKASPVWVRDAMQYFATMAGDVSDMTDAVQGMAAEGMGADSDTATG